MSSIVLSNTNNGIIKLLNSNNGIINFTLSPTSPPGILDSLSSGAKSTLSGVYACKLLLSSYTGPVLNLRSSSGAVSDFYADINGNLTTSTGTTYSSWISSNTAYVTTWYDQSGNNNHATQTTQSSQPGYDDTNKRINFTVNSGYFNVPPGVVATGTGSKTTSVKIGDPNNGVVYFTGRNARPFGNNIFTLLTINPPQRYFVWLDSMYDVFGVNPRVEQNAVVSVIYDSIATRIYLFVDGVVNNSNPINLNITSGSDVYTYIGKSGDGEGGAILPTQLYNIVFANSSFSYADRIILESI